MKADMNRLRAFFLLLWMLPALAWAQILDRIDIERVDDEAEVRIRFNLPIQYVRHTPLNEGKFVRIFIHITDSNFSEPDAMQETLRSPRSTLVPRFSVTYPELRNGMLLAFEKSTTYTVRQGEDGRSLVLRLPLLPGAKETTKPAPTKVAKPVPSAPAVETIVAPTVASVVVKEAPSTIAPSSPDDPAKAGMPPPMPPEEVDRLTKRFLAEAREARQAKDLSKAINRLNRILGMPQSAQTEAAQALIGEVREDMGEITKARAEYEVYLKLYPNGEDVARLKARLAALPKQDPSLRAAERARQREAGPAEWQVYGSAASYFYTGQSSTDGGPAVKDQSSSMTTLSANARLRDGATDTRIVYRDAHNRNYMASNKNYDRIYSLYVERTDRDVGYFVRSGRQSPNGSGVMERFDGFTGTYNLNPDWRIGGVAGTAVEFNTPYKKTFYGTNLEWMAQPGRPGINAYFIQQDVDGYLSRRAVGSEVRYFDGGFNGYGTLDYDLLYKGFNTAMLQLNHMDGDGNNYYASADRRRTPTLGLLNGLMLPVAAGATDVAGMVNASGMGLVRSTIEKGTPTSNMYALGVTHPLTERWQIGGDLRISSISGANAVVPLSQICDINSVNEANGTCLAPNGTTVFLSSMCSTWSLANNTCAASQQASGTTTSYTFQAIGNNLFVTNGIGVINVSLTQGPNYTGQNYAVSYIFPFRENWRLESNVRYYTQKSDAGDRQTRSSPSVKLAYQWRSAMFLEAEIGRDMSKAIATDGTSSTVRRDYLYTGVRWDFR